MIRSKRIGSLVAALALVGGAATTVAAQIPGMPLFTNPRYGTGLRIHGDYGQPTNIPANSPDLQVLQAGVSLALGPLGLNANVGTSKSTAQSAQGCVATPTLACSASHATASALAQLRVYGAGMNNVSLSLFGGGSIDLNVDDALASASGGGATLANNKEIHIPVGVAIGFHVPLGVASLNLWGAPRYNLTRYTNCSGPCPTAPDGAFGWAVGADIPIFRILSVRAAYDSHQVKNTVGGTTTTSTVNVIGVGASIGIGGMR